MAYSSEHYFANKEQYAAKSKAWREKNKERARENRRRNYLENKERQLEYSVWYNLKRKFNLSKEEYLQLAEKQNHVCAICSKADSRALAVDHDHVTGKVRGLLCSPCNRGIGFLKDSPQLLKNAWEYLNAEI